MTGVFTGGKDADAKGWLSEGIRSRRYIRRKEVLDCGLQFFRIVNAFSCISKSIDPVNCLNPNTEVGRKVEGCAKYIDLLDQNLPGRQNTVQICTILKGKEETVDIKAPLRVNRLAEGKFEVLGC